MLLCDRWQRMVIFNVFLADFKSAEELLSPVIINFVSKPVGILYAKNRC